jgi:hypothetical protein
MFFNAPFLSARPDFLEHYISFNYYTDLSDTYGVGGNYFSGEYVLSINWYGVDFNFGFYQSQSTSKVNLIIDEINESFEIPVEEMAIMKMGSISGLVKPVQRKWLEIDILFGAAFGKASHSMFSSLEYTYSSTEKKLTSLTRDYVLISKNHFGYQAGMNVSFLVTRKFGIQLNGRMNDMNNGGTFFLVGGGFVFKL